MAATRLLAMADEAGAARPLLGLRHVRQHVPGVLLTDVRSTSKGPPSLRRAALMDEMRQSESAFLTSVSAAALAAAVWLAGVIGFRSMVIFEISPVNLYGAGIK